MIEKQKTAYSELFSPERDIPIMVDEIRKQLEERQLRNIHLSSEIVYCGGQKWEDGLKLGIIGGGDLEFCTLASSEGARTFPQGEQSIPIYTFLLFPGLKWFGRNPHTNLSEASFFFAIENGIIYPVASTKPIKLDGLFSQFHRNEFHSAFETHETAKLGPIVKLAAYKNRAKDTLGNASLYTPFGVYLTDEEKRSSWLRNYLHTSFAPEFVIKPNDASCGTGVKMFSRSDNPISALRHAKALANKGYPMIVEDRIPPLPLEAISDEVGTTMDWNIRSLGMLGKDIHGKHALYVDAEIRYAPRSYDPINISKGASASLVEVLPPELQKLVEDTTEAALESLYQKTFKDGGEILGLIGLDIILHQTAGGEIRPYIIEVNAGPVGGFSTLWRLKDGPIDSIRDRFIPAFSSFLAEKRVNRDRVRLEVREKRYAQTPLEPEEAAHIRGEIIRDLLLMKRDEFDVDGNEQIRDKIFYNVTKLKDDNLTEQFFEVVARTTSPFHFALLKADYLDRTGDPEGAIALLEEFKQANPDEAWLVDDFIVTMDFGENY